MDGVLSQRLLTTATSLGVTLRQSDIHRFGRYLDLLLLWNRRINLTAVRDPAGVVDKHFIDCLALIPHLPPTVRRVIDVGSGAGFPGAVIALLRPDVLVTLVESNHKKAAFLEALRRELGLSNATVCPERIESLLAAPGFAPFDVAVSRATWPVPEWLTIGRQLVRAPGGTVIGMEGAERHPLPPGCERYPYDLAGVSRAIVVLTT